jgi:hypothetical protein
MNKSNRDLLTYKKKELAGMVICDKKKEDVTAATKPKVKIPDTLKLVQAGHRCKSASKLIMKEDLATLKDKIAK